MITLEGVLKIHDASSKTLNKITAAGKAADEKLEGLGKTMDKMGSSKGTQGLKNTEKAVKDMGDQTTKTKQKVTMNMEQVKSRIASSTRHATSDIERVTIALKVLDRTNANPNIRLEGAAEAIAMTRVLKRELDKLQRDQAKAALGNLGLAGTSALAGGAGGGGGALTAVGNAMAFIAAKGGLMVAMLLALAPAVVAFTGALSALVGVLGGAALGAGAGAVGLIGTFGVGLAGLAGAFVPVVKRIGEAKKALDEYNAAVEQYGKNSAQAAKAQRAFDQFGRAGDLVLEGRRVSGQFRRRTTRGRSRVMSSLEDSLEFGRNNFMDDATMATNRSARGFSQFSGSFLDSLDRPDVHKGIDKLSRMFMNLGPEMGDIFAQLGRVFINIAVAAKPHVIEFVKWVDKLTMGWANNTSNIKQSRDAMSGWMKDLKATARFLEQAGRLIGAFFGLGRGPGRDMLGDMTAQMREWRLEIEANPKGTRDWFRSTIEDAKDLSREIGALAQSFAEFADSLRTLIEPFTKFQEAIRNATPGDSMDWVTQTLATGGVLGGANYLRKKIWGKITGKGASTTAKSVAKGTGILGGIGRTAGKVAGGGAGFLSKLAGKAGMAGRFLGPLGAAGSFLMDPGDLAVPLEGDSAAAQRLENQIAGAQRRFGNEWWRKDKVVRRVMRSPGLGQDQGTEQGFVLGTGGYIQNVDDEAIQGGISAYVAQQRGAFGLPGMGAPSKKAQNKTALAQATAMLEGATKRARAATERLNKSLERVEKTARGAAKGVRQLNGAIRNIDNAFGNMLLNVIKKLALLGTSGAVVLTMVFAMWAKIITDFTDKVGDKWDGMMDRVRKRTINGVESVTEQWQSMREKMIDDNEAMFKSTKESFRGIVNELKKALGAMGFKGADLARAMEDGGTTGGGGRASKATRGPGARRAARGLRLPGRGLRDTVALGNDVMAAPGELVVNRHTEARINHLLAAQGTTLGHEVWNEGRPHNIPATQQRLARGGRKKGGSVGTVVEAIGPEAIAPFTYASDHDGTNRHMHIAMSTSSAIVAFGRLLQSMGYQVSEHPAFGGVGGGHAPTGYHYSGQAIDVNTANNETTAEVARVAALLRGGKVGGAIGGMAGASIPAHQMRRRRGFQGGGPAHRAASQRAIDILTGAAQGKINAKAGRAGPMGPGGQVGGTMSMAQIERLARSVGMPNPHLMAAIAMAESGGRVGVINSIGATGLWQVLQSAHPQYSEKMLLSAKGNALAAKEILGSQGLSAWEAYTMGMHTQYMARGGRTKIGGMPDWGGWNAKGGSFTVNRPTLFGAGESGQETVHISPKGKGGRRGGGVSVHIDKIEYNGKGDVKKAIEEEFRNLRVDLIGVGPEDD